VTTVHEVALLRLVAQRIAGPGFGTVADAVGWMGALQAQDASGVLTSVALRTADGSRRAVEAAFDAGTLVKSWPMRGTLHVVAAEDLPWMLELLAPRVVAGAAARSAALGLDEAAFEKARSLVVDALSGGRRLARDELLAVWDRKGLMTAGQRGYHVLARLAQTGTVCFGPVDDGRQLVVLVAEWIRQPRRLGRDEALAEVAWRYFSSHGPATVKDFVRWTKLVTADARAGLALARPRLERIEVDGIEHFMDPQTPGLLDACRAEARTVFLLPGFDEFILGYGDRTAVLPAPFAPRIVPGANGVFRPTIVSDGEVVGTWQHVGRGDKRALATDPFRPLPSTLVAAIETAYRKLPEMRS
jgi:hypothetical protein